MNLEELISSINEEKEDVGFHVNIEKETIENNNFRKVLFSGPNAQLVVMSLKPDEDIGLETHDNLDQFIRVDSGKGTAVINGKEYSLKDGDAIIVPAGAEHNIVAGSDGIKLYAVYTSIEHPDGVIDKTKKDAIKREKSNE